MWEKYKMKIVVVILSYIIYNLIYNYNETITLILSIIMIRGVRVYVNIKY